MTLSAVPPPRLFPLLDQFGFGGEWHWGDHRDGQPSSPPSPMIVLFFLGQRHFVEGIATTGGEGLSRRERPSSRPTAGPPTRCARPRSRWAVRWAVGVIRAGAPTTRP
ncbi:hypothetical protein [Georgenia sp. SUBG003]|uniref:hypothetical protein n=1 Tax=Georgenia sp. SUBG003 TaxID=1497974 RepID=UPI003AB3E53D